MRMVCQGYAPVIALGLLAACAPSESAPLEKTPLMEAQDLPSSSTSPPAGRAEGVSPASPTLRARRLTRFLERLTERRRALAAAGGTGTLGPRVPGTYDRTILLDPRQVTGPLANAVARYDSYLERIAARMREEDLVRTSGVVVERPAGYVAPEEVDASAGAASYDATDALRGALERGNVWLTPGKTYRVTRVIEVPSDRTIASDGSGTLLIATGPGTAFVTADVGAVTVASTPIDATFKDLAPILVRGRSNVTLRDLCVRMASEPGDNQPLLTGGIEVRDAQSVHIEGLELLGFPRTRGVLRVRSSEDVILRDNLLHGSFTSQLTRQVTGIEIDNERSKDASEAFLNTQRFEVTGNFIFGLMVDPAVYKNTYYRVNTVPRVANGYETDGINVQGDDYDGVKGAGIVAGNTIMDVGEGIDDFRSDIVLRDNHIERAYSYGLKLVHRASRNLVAGNRVIATGMSSVVVADYTPAKSPPELARSNVFVENSLEHAGVFRLDTWEVPVPQDAVAGAFLSDTKQHTFLFNDFSFPAVSSPRYRAAGYVFWASPGTLEDTNVFRHNTFTGFAPERFYQSTFPEGITSQDAAPVMTSGGYAGWIADGVQFETAPRLDHHGFAATARRLVVLPTTGGHTIRVSQPVEAGKRYSFTALVARGTTAVVGLRDQSTPFLVDFELEGEGRVLSRMGAVDDARAYRLSDRWYLLSVSYTTAASASAALLTILPRGVAGASLDLGEARLDRE